MGGKTAGAICGLYSDGIRAVRPSGEQRKKLSEVNSHLTLIVVSGNTVNLLIGEKTAESANARANSVFVESETCSA